MKNYSKQDTVYEACDEIPIEERNDQLPFNMFGPEGEGDDLNDISHIRKTITRENGNISENEEEDLRRCSNAINLQEEPLDQTSSVSNKRLIPLKSKETVFFEAEDIGTKSDELKEIVSLLKKKESNTIINKIAQTRLNFKHSINKKFFDLNYRNLKSMSSGVSENKQHIQNLYEIQNFKAQEKIYIAKFSYSGAYLATAGSCELKIWEVLSSMNEIDYLQASGPVKFMKLISEIPNKVYKEHSDDILDLCWSKPNPTYVLTAGLDCFAILYDVRYDKCVGKFSHSSLLSSVSFLESPGLTKLMFISGCCDKIIRIWDCNEQKVADYLNCQEIITAVAFFPRGDMVMVGSLTAQCYIYEYTANFGLKYSYSFLCRNKSGKYSDGTKITGIEFISQNLCFITTNDSRIRLVNALDGKVVEKYKGLKNSETMIKAFYSPINELIISASDDSFNYCWNVNTAGTNTKINSYESFQPFRNDSPLCSLFAGEDVLVPYMKKTLPLLCGVFINNIIVSCSSSGRIQITLSTS